MANELTIVNDVNQDLLAAYGITPGSSGFDDFGAEDVQMGWLRIAAKNTDAANEDSKDYIKGLKPGFFFNTLSKKVYGKTLKLIVLRYFKSYSEHTPGQNGEFVRPVSKAEVDAIPPTSQQNGHYILPSGNIIKEQANYLVLLPEYPEEGIVRFPLSTGSYKHVKNWNGQILKTPDIWTGIWEVSTSLMTSKQGQTYYSIGSETTTNVSRAGYVPLEIVDSVKAALAQARQFNTEPSKEDRSSFIQSEAETVEF